MDPSAYSFEPTDWTTITPLLNELVNMQVSKHDFMDWLDQWNQLDIGIWDAYTQLKHPAYVDVRNLEAESAYQAYVKELYSTYIDYTGRLINQALTIQPEPPTPTYRQLWRRWHNQAVLATPENLPIQAEISQIENHYRSIMWQADGTRDYWASQRSELNELMLRLIILRRTLAHNSGLSSYLEYRWCELNRLDYTIDDCKTFHRAVEKRIPAIAEFRASGKLPEHCYSDPEVGDLDKLIGGAERILGQVNPDFGDIFHQMRDGYLDLGHRSHKAASNESWFFPGIGMPYIHVASGNVGSVFHESGHAIHDYLSFQAHGSMWNLNGPEIFQEFAATSMDMLCWPYLEESRGGLYTTEESVLARQSVLRLYLDFCLARCVLEDAFEHWVYGEAPDDVTAAALDAKWLELKAIFEPWDDAHQNDVELMTGWQRNTWSLFRMPLYMVTYAMSMVGTCQLARLTAEDRTAAIQRYKHALSLGNTEPLPTLFHTVGLKFPFTEQDVDEAVRFVFENDQDQ